MITYLKHPVCCTSTHSTHFTSTHLTHFHQDGYKQKHFDKSIHRESDCAYSFNLYLMAKTHFFTWNQLKLFLNLGF